MKTFSEGIFTFIIVSILLSDCSELEIRKSGLATDQILEIDNLIIDELMKQDFDLVKSEWITSNYTIEVKINNIPETMILDTGASFTFLRDDNYSKFNLKKISTPDESSLNVDTLFSKQVTNLYTALADTFIIGRTELMPWPFVLGNKFINDAVLGCDFLHFTSAVLICDAGVLLISIEHIPASNIGNILKRKGYSEIDLIIAKEKKHINMKHQLGDNYKTLDSGVFFVPVSFEDMKGLFLIDTGGEFTLIDSAQVKRSFSEITTYRSHYLEDATGKRKDINSISVENFQIGNFNVGNKVKVGFMELNKTDYIDSTNRRIPVLGIIGVDILCKNNAVIDFGNHKLYLQR
jgi:gag-polyprotein putative aspartyl protease